MMKGIPLNPARTMNTTPRRSNRIKRMINQFSTPKSPIQQAAEACSTRGDERSVETTNTRTKKGEATKPRADISPPAKAPHGTSMDNSTLHLKNNIHAGANKDNSLTTVSRDIMGASAERTEYDSDAHTTPMDDKDGSRPLPQSHPNFELTNSKTHAVRAEAAKNVSKNIFVFKKNRQDFSMGFQPMNRFRPISAVN